MLAELNTAGQTDQAVADATGLTQATVNRIRNGKHPEPKLATWKAISEFYLARQAEAAVAGGRAAGEGGHAAP